MTQKILIAGQFQEQQGPLDKYLCGAGFTPQFVSTGSSALELMATFLPDIVVIAFQLPDVSTQVVIEAIKKSVEGRNIPVLLICDAGEDCLHVYIDSGADDYLIKPLRKKELIFRIQSLLCRFRKDNQLLDAVKALEEEKMNMLSEMEQQHDEAQELLISELLYDKITGFPTTPTLMKEIHEILENNRSLDIIYFCISKLKKVEEVFGWQIIDTVLEFIAKRLEELARQTLTEQDILAIDRAAGDDFIIFISSPENFYKQENMPLSLFGEKIIEDLKQAIDNEFGKDIAFQFEFYLGVSTLVYNTRVRLERLVYNSIREAISTALDKEQRSFNQNVCKLQEMIRKEEITTLYQPIVNLRTFEIIGFEAISRGQSDNFYQQPELLFDLASRADIIWQLERLCRKQALENAHKLPQRALLFINLDPNAANDPDLKGSKLLLDTALPPARIVLEITERANISDYHRFKQYINQLKNIGFHCAIDDAGSGYASLQSITEISPDFIKFDMALVRDIHKTYIKQSLVEILVKFSHKMNIPIIAEGIETLNEYLTLLKLGVTLGQGYLFSRPQATFEEGIRLVGSFSEFIKAHEQFQNTGY